MTTKSQSLCDIVILGAGYAGLMAALSLGRVSGRKQSIVLVNAIDQFVERVRLQEAIAADCCAYSVDFGAVGGVGDRVHRGAGADL